MAQQVATVDSVTNKFGANVRAALADDFIAEPASDGAEGQALLTDGAGGRSWGAVTATRVALYLPGTSGNCVSAPDSAGLSVTGDLDLRLCVTRDWSGTAAIEPLIYKYDSAQVSWRFLLDGTGTPVLAWNDSGGSAKTRPASTALPTGTAKLWVRVTLDVDNGAGNHTVKFYTSADGTTWTQLGTDSVGAGTTTIADTTATVDIGGNTATNVWLDGLIHSAEIRSGIDGTVVGAWDGSWAHDRQRDSAGTIWTVTGTANAWQEA